jgi:hypothetical protein
LLKELACVKIGQELWKVDATTKKLDVASKIHVHLQNKE